jgi:hypothetical protein
MTKLPLILAALAVLAISFPSAAQQAAAPAPIKRTILQRFDVPGSPNYETVTGIAEKLRRTSTSADTRIRVPRAVT